MTNAQRLGIILAIVNLGPLVFLMTHGGSAIAQDDAAILRGRGLELVDATGRVRAQFRVEPDGEAVFRIFDGDGTIRVKLGAGAHGSGLLLLDETTEPGVQIIKRTADDHERQLDRLEGRASGHQALTEVAMTNRRESLLNASLLLSAGSLFLALVSILLGRRVDYYDHLSAFNLMAAAMLSLGVAAFVVGLVGTWKARGRSVAFLAADVLALFVVGLYVFDR